MSAVPDCQFLERAVRARADDIARKLYASGAASLTKDEHTLILGLLAAGAKILHALNAEPRVMQNYVRHGGAVTSIGDVDETAAT